MLFHVLGPLEVHGDTAARRPVAGKPAILLATLLLQPNAWVTVDELVETIWPEQAGPTSARANLKTYVWQVRRLLPDHDGEPRIEGRPGAYRVRVGAGELDADRLGELATEARRTTDPATVVHLLEKALGLWRGRPFDSLDTVASRAVLVRLEQRRLEILEALAEAQGALGRDGDAVATLRAVTAEAPLRESTWVRLVRALHAAGLRAEAVATYRQARTVLRAELGVEPGPALAEAYRLVLDGAPAVRARRELPRDVPLIGRAEELASVGGAAPVVLVEGMAGAGKTAFAVHAAHRLAPSYPDGQLYLDVGGGRLDSGLALARLLRALGAEVPSDVEERAALWRSELSRRRVLLVLDGVPDGEYLAPLLPAGSGCRTLVTTANRSWHIDGAVRIALRPLGFAASAQLFLAAAGAEATPAVLRHCGGLPAALRDAAARLKTRPQWTVERLAADLDDDPCRTLTGTVRSITAAAQRLAGAERAVWRALTDLPAEFGVASASRAAGVPAGPALEGLVDRGLLEVATADRYRSHPVLRHLAGCAARPAEFRRVA